MSTRMNGSVRPPVARGYRPAVLVFLLSILISVVAFAATRHSEARRRESEFKELAIRPVAAVQERIGLYLEEIQSIGRFYAASRFVERSEFGAFVQGISSRRGAIEALAWAPRVPAAGRAAFESDARGQVPGDFQILEPDKAGDLVRAAQRDTYYPLWYVEPAERDKAVLGLDLGSNPVYLEALMRARNQGALVATRSLAAMGDAPAETAVAAILPIYFSDILHGEVTADTDDQLYGLVVAIFRIGDLVDEALARSGARGVVLRIYDQKEGPARPLVYARPGLARAAGEEERFEGVREPPQGLVYAAAMEVADRTWLMECTPSPEYLAATRSWQSWAVLAVGLLFSCLLAAYVGSVVGRAAWADQLVRERTGELSEANQRLQGEIAERRRAEEALRSRNRELESFVYMASHDLRTPLVSIEGFARLLAEDYSDRLDDEGKEYLWRVRANAANMDSLLRDLLELSRVTSTEEPKERVSVAAVLTQVLDELDHAIKESRAEVVLPDDLPTVSASPTRLRQVFSNLISNAIKFAREGVDPRVEVVWKEGAGEYRFRVKDNGIGIPEEHRDDVFELFGRLKEKDVPGSGVGLAIVKRIVEAHGGEVGVEGAAGEGSTFWFTLPKTV